MTKQSLSAQADETIKNYMLASAAVGLVPVPLVDVLLLSGIQLKMLNDLAKLYGSTFSEQRGKSFIAALAGGGMPLSLSFNLSSLVKATPYGAVVNTLSLALLGSASTYAIGKLFIQHYESGGTFLSFDPQQVRARYSLYLVQGKEETRRSFVGIKP